MLDNGTSEINSTPVASVPCDDMGASDRPKANADPEPSDSFVSDEDVEQPPPVQQKRRKANDGSDPIQLTDMGNAQRFQREFGDIIRFCYPVGKWYVWDGKRWRVDDTGRIMAMAKQTIAKLFRWAQEQIAKLQQSDDEEAALLMKKIKAVLDWALKSQDARKLKAMVELAKSEPGIPILPSMLDADHWLLNCENGTLDLRTFTIREHRQSDNITKLCPTPYTPGARCHVFLATVNGIFKNDARMIEHVRRFQGYCLTGETREHIVPISFGSGSNGKTLYWKEICETMGSDYAGTVPPELLMETRSDQHPTIKADLFGKRLMVAEETGQGARLNEERVKALSGSGEIKCRRMREDLWAFKPTFKLIMTTNHRPEIRGQDHGIWRRLALWPFQATFWDADKGETGPPELKADKGLAEKLQREREGILAWMVEGCRAWQQHGLAMPDSVRAATSEYRSAEDRLGAFLIECCQSLPGISGKATEIYGAYRTWCEGSGERYVSKYAFTQAMGARGISLDAGKRNYEGVALLPKETDKQPARLRDW